VAERYNVIRPTVARDFYEAVGAPEWAKFKIVFKKSKAGTLPPEFEGTQFYKSRAEANQALKAKQKFILESREAKKKPPKVINPKDYKGNVKTRIPGVGLEKISTTTVDNVTTKTYKDRATGKTTKKYFSKLVDGEFPSVAAATKANKEYRIKNPIKNAPPDLKTLDEQKLTRYLKKQDRSQNILERKGYPAGGPFAGDLEVHKGHAGNIRGKQLITGDKVIRTPGVINQMMSGDEGTVAKNRFTDLDFKIENAEKEIDRIKNSNMSAAKKKKLLAVQDDKLIKYASQSDGYKVVQLSDGNEFRLPGRSLQSIDPFDDFPGWTEKDIGKFLKKYKNMKVTPGMPKSEVDNIVKAGMFIENMNVSKQAGATALEEIKTIYADEPDGSAFRKAIDNRVKCADGCFLKVANKNPERIAKLFASGQITTADNVPQPEKSILRDEFKEANVRWNNDVGAFETPNGNVATQEDLKLYAEENPMEVKVGEEPPKVNKSVLKTVGKTLAKVGAPLPTALLDSYFIGQQVKDGKSTEEIAKDPLNWVGLAAMEPLSKVSGIAESGGLNKALRLGLNPATIRGISRFAGLPGLAISTAMTAYDQYKKYQNEEGFVYNLFNKEGN